MMDGSTEGKASVWVRMQEDQLFSQLESTNDAIMVHLPMG